MSLSPYVRKGKTQAAVGDFGSVTTVTTVTAGTYVKASAASGITAYAGGGQTTPPSSRPRSTTSRPSRPRRIA